MAVTIQINGTRDSNSLVHKGSNAFIKSTLPDVCKTSTPGGPVPIPYPIIFSFAKDLTKGTKTVKADGKKMIAVKGSQFSRCTGDEPGKIGGVKSNTNMKEAKWLMYSFNVKMDGKNACRLADKMTMNHANTVGLAGVKSTSVSVTSCPPHTWIRLSDQDSVEDRIQKLENSSQSGDQYNACVARKLQKSKEVDVSARYKCDCGAYQEVDIIADGKPIETKAGNQSAKKKQTLNYREISNQLLDGSVTIYYQSSERFLRDTPHVKDWGATPEHFPCSDDK